MVCGVEPSALPPGAPEYKACREEPPTAEEMTQVEHLLNEVADLSAQGLTGAAVAISFCRRLTQPIQERVHPAFEYWVIGTQPGGRIARFLGRKSRTGSPASWRGRSGTRAAPKPTA